MQAAANDNYPLMLSRQAAAAMCGISVSTFSRWVRRGILPPAAENTRRWSRVIVEQALAGDTKGQAFEQSEFEKWSRSSAH
jgi:hypothetical protein